MGPFEEAINMIKEAHRLELSEKAIASAAKIGEIKEQIECLKETLRAFGVDCE